ncbi:hypothetical protein GGI25_004655 [Coemansia spiralis]|uniref:Uncharacterized protein n=2 Tax=Coemansia TaxID=4863 RepID=A0A9W8G4E8_9FUNG|nr:hypothetical protein BX070DRAFT_84943 [Coemansia spiralis]KAJ1989611.1 hypothetical protein EDC05_004577 [Coemansia umbellata]KAJ2620580.1 hypothetical protein GGI26_004869 [Coemansia sp. RSA 1358]KAJ2673600.1 hypothetical protein GGI25_004655 [Coemansia spiralis]
MSTALQARESTGMGDEAEERLSTIEALALETRHTRHISRERCTHRLQRTRSVPTTSPLIILPQAVLPASIRPGHTVSHSLSSLYADTLGASNTVAAPSGTLSPQYTLVNSDGASLRVHTGSIRERHTNRMATEDDSFDSRVSDSLFLFSTNTVPSMVFSPPRNLYYVREEDELGASRGLVGHVRSYPGADENDAFSMVSGFSDGMSTARMRMATDRAYNALRIGPNAAAAAASLLNYYNNVRPISLATSSDPGMPSAGSVSEYYYNTDEPARPSSDSGSSQGLESNSENADMVSIVRSDVAVYGGEDVKFPFLPDNLSELGGSAYSPDAVVSPASYELASGPHTYRLGGGAKIHKKRRDQAEELSGRAVYAGVPHRGHFYSRYRSGSGIGRDQVIVRATTPQPSATSPTVVRPNAIMRFLRRITPKNQ